MDPIQRVWDQRAQLVQLTCYFLSYSDRDNIVRVAWCIHIMNIFSLVCLLFPCLDLSWRYLKLNPRDRKSGDKSEYVSLRLRLDDFSVRSDTVVEASFKFLIYDQSYGKHYEHQGSLVDYSWNKAAL
jgi:hypothetical protein